MKENDLPEENGGFESMDVQNNVLETENSGTLESDGASETRVTTNEVKFFVHDMQEYREMRRERLKRRKRFLLIFTIIYFLGVFLLFSFLKTPENTFYEKAPIKAAMQKAIKSGCELSSVKHIYDTRLREKKYFLFLPNSEKDYYEESYPLSKILKDLLVDYYIKTEKAATSNDTVYFNSLIKMIEENEKHNPFDNLEDNQKYNFQNIQEKLDSTYEKVKPDVIKIADEMNSRNQLIARYLNRAESSYYISIAALLITIILAGYQIFQNYNSDKRISDKLEGLLSKLSNKKNDKEKLA